MIELLRRGRLERDDLHALRVDTRHDVLDHRVLARRVHRLEDDEQRVPVARPQQLLRFGELRAPTRDRVLRPLLQLVRSEIGQFRAAGPPRVPAGEACRLAGSHDELVEKALPEVHSLPFYRIDVVRGLARLAAVRQNPRRTPMTEADERRLRRAVELVDVSATPAVARMDAADPLAPMPPAGQAHLAQYNEIAVAGSLWPLVHVLGSNVPAAGFAPEGRLRLAASRSRRSQ